MKLASDNHHIIKIQKTIKDTEKSGGKEKSSIELSFKK